MLMHKPSESEVVHFVLTFLYGCIKGSTCCDMYVHYACVADCANAMADAWEGTVGCAHADCLHGNILKC